MKKLYKLLLNDDLANFQYLLCIFLILLNQFFHLLEVIILSSTKGLNFLYKYSVQLSSVTQSCPTLCDPMNHSTPGLLVHGQLPEITQTHVHWVGDAIRPSHPLSSPLPLAPNPSQHQGLFQWVNSLHEVAKLLEFQLQHQSFQWTPRTDFLYFFLIFTLFYFLILY